MASIWKETFEASEFDNSYDSEVEDAGCTSDGDDAGPGSLPLAKSTKCYETITANDSTGNDAYIYKAWAGDESATYFTGHVYIDTHSLATGEWVIIHLMQNSATVSVYSLYFMNHVVGGLIFIIYFYNNGALEWSTSSSVSVDTWYKIQIKYDTAGDFQFVVDDSIIQTKTLTGTVRTPRKIGLGQIGNLGDTGNTIYWDACEWDDSEYPAPEETAVPIFMHHYKMQREM